MVPKVNKFDFYTIETIHGHIIQLVGESRDLFEPSFLTKEQISKIQKRVKLCAILSHLNFIIDSYGLINFFVDYESHLEHFITLKELLHDFNDFQSIEFIEKSLQFREENIEAIQELRSYPDDYESKHEELDEKLYLGSTLYNSAVLIDKEIRKNPNNFCFDEFGRPIDPHFSGDLKRFYPNGNLRSEYSFLNGRVHGEGMEYTLDGKKQYLKLFKNGNRIKILKSWDKEGNEHIFQ